MKDSLQIVRPAFIETNLITITYQHLQLQISLLSLVLTILRYPLLGRFRPERKAGAEGRPAHRAARRHCDGPEGHRSPVPTNLFRHRLHLVGSVGFSAVRPVCEEAVLGASGQRLKSKRRQLLFSINFLTWRVRGGNRFSIC